MPASTGFDSIGSLIPHGQVGFMVIPKKDKCNLICSLFGIFSLVQQLTDLSRLADEVREQTEVLLLVT